MSFTYSAKGNTNATQAVGHAFQTLGGNDIYSNTIFFTSFDLTAYTPGHDADIYGPSADGVCTQTETIPSGNPPTPMA